MDRHDHQLAALAVAEPAEVLGIRRYVQSHTVHPQVNAALQGRNDGSPEPYDGVAELWFDDLDAVMRDDPSVLQASAELLEDERSFIDLAASPIWVSVEHVVVG